MDVIGSLPIKRHIIFIYHDCIRTLRVSKNYLAEKRVILIITEFSDVGAIVCRYEDCNQKFRHENLLKQHVSDAHLSKDSPTKDLHAESYSGETNPTTKEQNIFFGHSDKYVNGSMDLNIPDSLMPEVLNDVCNEVTIYTDF